MKKLLSMFLTVSLCIGISGCSKNEPKPQETLTAMIDAYKAQKWDDLQVFYEGNETLSDSVNIDEEFNADDEEMAKLFFDKMCDVDYTIDDEKIDENKATVTLTITANNVGEKLKEGFQQAIVAAFGMAFSDKSEEEIQKEMSDIMFSPIENCEKNYKSVVEVHLVKNDDGEWLITSENNEDLVNALTGGLLDFSNELDKISSGEEE